MKWSLVLILTACLCHGLAAQSAIQWSFDHIEEGGKSAYFYNNQSEPSLEIVANGAELVPVQEGQRVVDPLKRTWHRNVGAYHSPAGVLTRSSVNTGDLPTEGSFTLEGFVRYPDAGQRNVFFLQVDYSKPRHGFEVGVWDNGELFSRIDLVDERGWSVKAPPVSGPEGVNFTDGKWHHIALVYNDANRSVTLWLDGKAGAEVVLPAPLRRPNKNLILGKLYNKQTQVWLDEVRLTQAALGAEDFLTFSDGDRGFTEVASLRTRPVYPLLLRGERDEPGQWGMRPLEGEHLDISPPSFVWPPERDVTSWELEVTAADSALGKVVYRIEDHVFSVHRPAVAFLPGKYVWRYRGFSEDGRKTEWSQPRSFEIAAGAKIFTLPTREAILASVPEGQPRLFLTPENLSNWRQLVKGPMAEPYQSVRKRVEQWVENPPPTKEPEPYLPEETRSSKAWFARWQNNYRVTLNAVSAIYLSGFVALIEEDDELATFAVGLMDDLLQWDAAGTTSFTQSSEASYAYVWGLARGYSFLYPWLTPAQRKMAQEKLTARGQEMYQTHVDRNHLWKPFDSHLNRTWHFLGELGLALHGEVEQADHWLWYAMNVFANVYPVWGGADGGWHEGGAYQISYMNRFMWWVVIMDEVFDINAYEVSPFFRSVGDFMLYHMPPNKVGAGWGDQAELVKANTTWNAGFILNASRLSGNGYYRNYAERILALLGDEQKIPVTDLPQLFLERYPLPPAKNIADLPPSRVFASTGQVVMNDSLTDASEAVQVQFKAAEFYGLFSHGYEANNSFKVWAYGERMLVKSGYRDSYGSPHHRDWMWSTRSVNNITVDGGKGQFPHSILTKGKLVDSFLGQSADGVVGEAGSAYFQQIGSPSLLTRFTRALVFIKPATVVVVDYLQAQEPRTFEYWLHSGEQFEIGQGGQIALNNNGVTMVAQILEPQGLEFTQTNQYDPNPHDNITLREWHLKATTAQKTRAVRFVSVYNFAPRGEVAQVNWTTREDGDGALRLSVTGEGRAGGEGGEWKSELIIPDFKGDRLSAEFIEVRAGGKAGAEAFRLQLPTDL